MSLVYHKEGERGRETSGEERRREKGACVCVGGYYIFVVRVVQ